MWLGLAIKIHLKATRSLKYALQRQLKARLDLESLERRRLYADVIMFYEIVFGLVDLHYMI